MSWNTLIVQISQAKSPGRSWLHPSTKSPSCAMKSTCKLVIKNHKNIKRDTVWILMDQLATCLSKVYSHSTGFGLSGLRMWVHLPGSPVHSPRAGVVWRKRCRAQFQPVEFLLIFGAKIQYYFSQPYTMFPQQEEEVLDIWIAFQLNIFKTMLYTRT